MPYDILVDEAKRLTEDEIRQVLDFIAYLHFKSSLNKAPAAKDNYDGWVRVPGQHGGLFEILDGFDDPIEAFDEYM